MTDHQTAADLWPQRSLALRQVSMEQRATGSTVTGLPSIPSFQVNRPVWPTRSTEQYAEFRSLSTTLYACLAYRANAVAAATVRVYREADNEALPDHPLRQLLQAPNSGQSEAEFLSLTQLVGDVAGFCPIEKVRSDGDRVVELRLLRPHWMRPILRDQADPDWEYRVPGHPPVTILAEDVMISTPSPALDNGPTGFSGVGVALRELGVERAMTDFLKSLFDRGAMPFIAITLDQEGQVDDDQKRATKEVFRNSFGGHQRWADPILLDNVKSVERIGYNLNELAFNDLRGVTDAAICQAMNVPPILIGAKIGLDRSTFSNTKEARRSFYEDTVAPLWARLDGTFSRGLVHEFAGDGISLEFDTSKVPALADDKDQRRKESREDFRATILTRNEARAEIGLKPLAGPEGDQFFAPPSAFGALPVGDAMRSNWPVSNEMAAIAMNAVQHYTKLLVQGRTSRGIEATGYEVRTIDGIERRYLPVTETRASIAEGNRKRFVRLADAFTPKVAEFFREQGERVAGSVRSRSFNEALIEYRETNGPGAPIPPGTYKSIRHGAYTALLTRDIAEPVVDWGSERDLLRELMAPFHVRVTEAALDAVIDQLDLGISFDLANPNVQQVLDQLAQRITDISETTRADVQRVVGEALDAGESVDDLATRLKALFTETYTGRAETVARTESQVAYSLGSQAGYQESGIVAQVQMLDNSSHTDDYGASDGLSCAQRDGMVIPVADIGKHSQAEHPNGTIAFAPITIYSEESV